VSIKPGSPAVRAQPESWSQPCRCWRWCRWGCPGPRPDPGPAGRARPPRGGRLPCPRPAAGQRARPSHPAAVTWRGWPRALGTCARRRG